MARQHVDVEAGPVALVVGHAEAGEAGVRAALQEALLLHGVQRACGSGARYQRGGRAKAAKVTRIFFIKRSTPTLVSLSLDRVGLGLCCFHLWLTRPASPHLIGVSDSGQARVAGMQIADCRHSAGQPASNDFAGLHLDRSSLAAHLCARLDRDGRSVCTKACISHEEDDARRSLPAWAPAPASSTRDAIRPSSSASSTRRSIAAPPCSAPTMHDLTQRTGRYHLRHARHADHGRARDGVVGALRRGRAPSWSRPGLAAIAVALLSCLKAGDHLLVTDSCLPAHTGLLRRHAEALRRRDHLLRSAHRRGHREPDAAEHHGRLHRSRRVRRPSRCRTFPAIAAVAHRHGAVVLMDNTWATPLFFPPHAMGVDLCIEAGTKYLSGSSDLLLGLVSANERCFQALRDAYRRHGHLPRPGGRVPRAARPAHHAAPAEGAREAGSGCRSLAADAPGSQAGASPRPAKRCPGHDIWKRDFTGSSGLFSIILHPAPHARGGRDARRPGLVRDGLFLGRLREPVVPFDCSTYRTATKWNPGGPALRLQIGLEDLDDLMADLDAGFARLRQASGEPADLGEL